MRDCRKAKLDPIYFTLVFIIIFCSSVSIVNKRCNFVQGEKFGEKNILTSKKKATNPYISRFVASL